MTDQIKSFKKDWKRWSSAERASAVALFLASIAALGGPITMTLL